MGVITGLCKQKQSSLARELLLHDTCGTLGGIIPSILDVSAKHPSWFRNQGSTMGFEPSNLNFHHVEWHSTLGFSKRTICASLWRFAGSSFMCWCIHNMVFVRLRVAHAIESGFDHSLQFKCRSVCTFLCLHRWRMRTVTHRYPTQGYQGFRWRGITGSISGLVDGAFRDWTDLFTIWQLFTLKLRLNPQCHEYIVKSVSRAIAQPSERLIPQFVRQKY